MIVLRVVFALMMLGLVSSCTNASEPLKIDSSYRTSSYNERIHFIIVHYTAENNEESLKVLTENRVSAHYLIMQGDYPVYQLVDDDKSAWHAGASSFAGRQNLNDTSLGIEIVNEGIVQKYRGQQSYPIYDHFVEYDEVQFKKIGKLLKQLSQTYQIKPQYILGHSDVSPGRKSDPGAKFPWERLYREYGVGAWYDENDKRQFIKAGLDGVSIQDIKREFRAYGYTINDTNEWDKASQDVVYAFQLHFNPRNATGKMDLETYAILKALNKKYILKE